MKKIILLICMMMLVAACASDKKYEKGEADVKKPVNCATAEGDIRSLKREKAHTEEQIAAGATSITPVGLVVSAASGKEKDKLKVTTGEYNNMIDKKIAEIKRECGIR